VLLHPSFPEIEVKREQKLALAAIEREQNTPATSACESCQRCYMALTIPTAIPDRFRHKRKRRQTHPRRSREIS